MKKTNYKVLDSTETIKEDGNYISNNTCFQGAIECSHGLLVELFGPPTWDKESDDGKVKNEWVLLFDDGRVATVYDWKEYDLPVENITDWHIGGKNKIITQRVEYIIDKVQSPIRRAETLQLTSLPL